MEREPFSVDSSQPLPQQMNSLDTYNIFSEAVMTEAIPFFQLAPEVYVVTGWDSKQGKRTHYWYHVQMGPSETGDLTAVCYCPSAKEKETCVHQRYLTEEGPLNASLPQGLHIFRLSYISSSESKGPIEQVILFWRDVVEDGWMNHFSVGIEGPTSSAKNRVVVTYVGADTGFGNWRCSKDGTNGCAHVTKCQVYLGQLLTASHGVNDYSMVITGDVPRPSQRFQVCISYLPIMVSDWARIPTDRILYDEPPPVEKVPNPIILIEHSRCSCGHPFHPESGVFEKECTVYTLIRPLITRIQLQKCPACNTIRYSSKAIGPDCRELGIFNYNNTLLFSHDLLDEYTSAFTSSETPFSAWIKVVVRRYQKWSTPAGALPFFVDESVFRRVWFGYVGLLELSNDMVCPRCGPAPETVIWDGVTLGYGKKRVLNTIYPPTSKHQDAISRDQRYPKNQCLIQDLRLRKLLSSIMSAPISLHDILSKSRNASIDSQIDVNVIDATIEKLREVEEAIELTGEKCGGLQHLLISYYGVSQLQAKGEPAVEARKFFSQISTNESCMQVINRPALKALEFFLERPSYETLPRLSPIPCLYHLAAHQWTHNKKFSLDLLAAFNWIRERVNNVLLSTSPQNSPPLIDPSATVDGGWKTSGCKYSLPQIRHRPQYPNMPSDISKEPKERGGICNKFYSEYGENKLTGGIMAAWCTHSICYGFHFIPESEGRNDVFSALITRWPKAPKYVIYDFACQLAPYCRAREPEFFADTTFLIDDFHALGHTRCSTAFFLKTYAQTQPVLGRINSSAAECGNGGLAKIRKSLRYMGQDRAILYASVFISIWNRLKILRM
ncbi:hypothetical protein AGABI1DRAFT_37971 [Agaricus bisporus var. burnettii JB137-S8]|uniref:HMG domain-containing protein n=1 Tax=Agaricus bisporus var. burnettii (strain JB137-S8 / ATCC MYA-4627 / FGSC 10392) TaxID=597362 RepID=K5W3F6_AGABU|nr:uncharacterized protein AGABI1DRAFT_37971 [Agaricus bisporus var. burnettii JB137-S8]EKM81329.1 hypothetical protein AGABI1DRAFT_37971 [Agaricus bisporus var. burnettii JB137-S8]